MKREQLQRLQERQLELRAIMAESDAHASKCQKLGLNFQQTYPDDYAAYNAANAEFNENEEKIKELYEQIEQEEEQAAMEMHHEEFF